MNRPTFMDEVVVALIAGLSTGVLWQTLTVVVAPVTAAKLVVTTVSGGYGLYLLATGCNAYKRRRGVLTLTLSWTLMAGCIWFLPVSLAVYLLLHVLLSCLLRSARRYTTVVQAAMDLVLTLTSACIATWVIAHTGSPALAAWCLFLTLAVSTLLPQSSLKGTDGHHADNHEQYTRARTAAITALRTLAQKQ